eukprot:SAG31_NODE_3682_length_3992_cov_2.502954_3_plen_46_part_00
MTLWFEAAPRTQQRADGQDRSSGQEPGTLRANEDVTRDATCLPEL